jgi:diaminopimelate decarboxylase
MTVEASSTSYWRRIEERMGIMDVTGLSGEPPATMKSVRADPAVFPLQLLPETAEVAPDGRLSIGGVDVLDVAKTVGTPVFLYDEAHLRSRCREARWAFGDGVAYASKAFLCKAMASLVHQEGMMIDVASGGELHVALRSGVPPRRLVFHGSNKSLDELALAIDVGLGRIVVDSFDEIERIERLAARPAGRTIPKVLVRINPGVDVCTHSSVATGQEDSKFGLSLSTGAAAEAVSRLASPECPVDLVGLHTHIGSQVFDTVETEKSIQLIAPLLLSSGLKELCVGGGLGVAYTVNEAQAPTLIEWAMAIRRACASAGIPEGVRVTAEPGRSIAATAAITCYTVGTIKPVPLASGSRTRSYVSVDGGMSDNPRPALYGSRYEAFLPREVTARRGREVSVVGKHCESGDILVRDGHLPDDLAVGDVLATPVTGAYGYAMASNYNKLPRPPVVFARDGRFRIVTRRQTYEDLLALDLPAS